MSTYRIAMIIGGGIAAGMAPVELDVPDTVGRRQSISFARRDYPRRYKHQMDTLIAAIEAQECMSLQCPQWLTSRAVARTQGGTHPPAFYKDIKARKGDEAARG